MILHIESQTKTEITEEGIEKNFFGKAVLAEEKKEILGKRNSMYKDIEVLYRRLFLVKYNIQMLSARDTMLRLFVLV